MTAFSKSRPPSTWLLTACGLWLVGLGLYFALLRPPLLPEDARYLGTSIALTRTAAPGLEHWLRPVFVVMGGFMASAGVLIVFVATTAIPRRVKGTSWTIGLSGVFSVALMSTTNFALASDFKWLLLVPAVAWLAGFALYLAGRSGRSCSIESAIRRPAAKSPYSPRHPSQITRVPGTSTTIRYGGRDPTNARYSRRSRRPSPQPPRTRPSSSR